jgi:hypothetical protein
MGDLWSDVFLDRSAILALSIVGTHPTEYLCKLWLILVLFVMAKRGMGYGAMRS